MKAEVVLDVLDLVKKAKLSDTEYYIKRSENKVGAGVIDSLWEAHEKLYDAYNCAVLIHEISEELYQKDYTPCVEPILKKAMRFIFGDDDWDEDEDEDQE